MRMATRKVRVTRSDQLRALTSRTVAMTLRASVFLSSLAFSPSPAEAQCAQWDASIKWTIQQDNGFSLAMRLQQNGTVLTGRATQQGERGQSGSVEGSLRGNQFKVLISWANGDTSVYVGAVRTDGRLDGVTHRVADPSLKVAWHSIRPLKCAPATVPASPAAAAAPAETPNTVNRGPIKSVGKRAAPNWDVSGSWQMNQSNGPAVSLQLKQTGTGVTGAATSGKIQGAVRGWVSGDQFNVRITWRGTATIVTKVDIVGAYEGWIGPQGVIAGTAVDESKSSSAAVNWSSSSSMKRYGEAANSQTDPHS